MGQQSNKVQKRRRRANYLERQKIKAKAAAVTKPAAAKKKAAPKKAAPAPAPAAASAGRAGHCLHTHGRAGPSIRELRPRMTRIARMKGF
jgi:hypothetical protein